MPSLNELLEAAKENPELKAVISKMLGTSDKVADAAENESAQAASRASRAKDLETALPPAPIKSAADSAGVFNQGQNFELQGPLRDGQNFRLVGEPHGTNYPVPSELSQSNLPVTRNASGVPSTLEANPEMRDVTPVDAGGGPPPAEPPALLPGSDVPSSGGGMSNGTKLGLGALAGGAALLGLGASDGDHPKEEASPERSPANAVEPTKEVSKDEESKEEPPKEIKKEASPSKEPKDSEAAEPDEETKAPQKQEAIPSYLNFDDRGNGQNELSQLLQQQKDEVRNQRMQEAGALIGGAFARVKPDTSMYDERIKDASLPIQQYQLKQQNEANDPNSGISQGMRDYMKKLGVNVSDNASAAHIQSVLPMVYKDIEAKQAQASHTEDLKNRLAMQQSMKEAQIDAAKQNKEAALANASAIRDVNRQDKQTQQAQAQANKMDQQAEQLRGNPAIQQDMRTLQRVQNAMSIIKQYPDPNQIPPNIINILNTDLATIAGGGVPGEGLIHEVSTPTLQSRVAGGVQQLLNHPTGANAAAFVKQNEGIFNTLSADAQKRLEDRYQRIGNTLGHNVRPEDRENYRRTYLPNHTYDKNGDFVPQQNQKSSQSQQSQSKYPPGSTVKVKGKLYTVAPNGDDLVPQ